MRQPDGASAINPSMCSASLLFSPRGEAKCVRGPSGRGARCLARAGVLEQYVEHGKQAQRSHGGRIVCFDRRVVRNAESAPSKSCALGRPGSAAGTGDCPPRSVGAIPGGGQCERPRQHCTVIPFTTSLFPGVTCPSHTLSANLRRCLDLAAKVGGNSAGHLAENKLEAACQRLEPFT